MSIRLYQDLHYITHADNLSSIVENGILSRTQLVRHGVEATDVSDPQVQRWRSAAEPIYRRAVHDYVPFYFNPRNPMLYRLKAWREELVILVLPVLRLAERVHLFTDGNAACWATTFDTDISVVHTSDAVLRASSWTDFQDGRRRRCAEMLVADRVPFSLVEKIVCPNPWSCDVMARTCSTGTAAVCAPHIFF